MIFQSPNRRPVLIVEDEPDALEASRRYLDRCGYDVDAAPGASQALQMAQERAPDIAICDWRLAGERDGVDVARELQQRFGTRIIFVTAYPLDELKEATRDLDVVRYLKKPISLIVLADTLSAVDPTA